MATPTLKYVAPTTPEDELSLAPEPVVIYGVPSGGGGDLSTYAQFRIVVTGNESRPTGDFVIWLDLREGEVSAPSNMGESDVRFRPGTVTPGVAPTITTTTLGTMTVGIPFTQTLTATGDTPITWDDALGTPPDGLTLSSGGVLSGTPTTASAYDLTVSAANAYGEDAQQYVGTVNSDAPAGGTTFWGETAPTTTGTIGLNDDGGGSLRTGVRFIATDPINVLGARLWNPTGSDSTFLNTDATLFAYVDNYTGAPVNGTSTFGGSPVASKLQTASRVAGEWTEVIFDTPVSLAALSTGTGALLTIGVEYAGGNYYITVPYATGGGDQITSPESDDVLIPSYDGAGGGVHNLSGNGGRAIDMIYGVDLIFELA